MKVKDLIATCDKKDNLLYIGIETAAGRISLRPEDVEAAGYADTEVLGWNICMSSLNIRIEQPDQEDNRHVCTG